MNVPEALPLTGVVRWLTASTGFPSRRLKTDAQVLVCLEALAANAEMEERGRYLIKSRDPAQTSAQRQHAQRRAQVHFKCDNSAKV